MLTQTAPPAASQIAEEILCQVAACKPGSSISPEDVARALDADWRRLLPDVRKVALTLARTGKLDILRKGKPVPPHEVKGVVRLRRPQSPPPSGPAA